MLLVDGVQLKGKIKRTLLDPGLFHLFSTIEKHYRVLFFLWVHLKGVSGTTELEKC